MMLGRKWFGEKVSQLKLGVHLSSTEKTIFKFISHIMAVKIKVFGSVVKHWVCSNVLCSLIITMKSHRIRKR